MDAPATARPGRLNVIEWCWMNYRDQLAGLSAFGAQASQHDAFYCGASAVVAVLAMLGRDHVGDAIERAVCSNMYDELTEFEQTSGYRPPAALPEHWKHE